MKKSILITGAGTGIGLQTVRTLAQRGHRVTAATLLESQAEAVSQELPQVQTLTLDVTQEDDRKKIEQLDIDVLINNAGIGQSGSLVDIPLERVRIDFEVNVFGALALSQLALKQMIQRRNGRIIFISSLVGRVPMPFLGSYSMAKGAVSFAADILKQELAYLDMPVYCSVIEPGGFATGFNQANLARKYEWMGPESPFFELVPRLKKEETRTFSIVECKAVDRIVRKIVHAVEARKPRLRYSAPLWQGVGIQILRALGR